MNVEFYSLRRLTARIFFVVASPWYRYDLLPSTACAAPSTAEPADVRAASQRPGLEGAGRPGRVRLDDSWPEQSLEHRAKDPPWPMISAPPSMPNFSAPFAAFSQARAKAATNSPFSQVDS